MSDWDYREHFELPFFNHFLKDKGEITDIKEVNVFDTGSERVARRAQLVADGSGRATVVSRVESQT